MNYSSRIWAAGEIIPQLAEAYPWLILYECHKGLI
jgi:hypothetical protein